MTSYNRVPAKVKEGSIATFKKKLKQCVLKNIPIDLNTSEGIMKYPQ